MHEALQFAQYQEGITERDLRVIERIGQLFSRLQSDGKKQRKVAHIEVLPGGPCRKWEIWTVSGISQQFEHRSKLDTVYARPVNMSICGLWLPGGLIRLEGV